MINKEEAKVDAWVAIADLMGREYFRNHFDGSCQSYPPEDNDDVEWKKPGYGQFLRESQLIVKLSR